MPHRTSSKKNDYEGKFKYDLNMIDHGIHFNSEEFNLTTFLANIYLLKVSNRNTRKRCEICSKLTNKNVIDVVLVFLLLTLNIFHNFLECFYR